MTETFADLGQRLDACREAQASALDIGDLDTADAMDEAMNDLLDRWNHHKAER